MIWLDCLVSKLSFLIQEFFLNKKQHSVACTWCKVEASASVAGWLMWLFTESYLSYLWSIIGFMWDWNSYNFLIFVFISIISRPILPTDSNFRIIFNMRAIGFVWKMSKTKFLFREWVGNMTPEPCWAPFRRGHRVLRVIWWPTCSFPLLQSAGYVIEWSAMYWY